MQFSKLRTNLEQVQNLSAKQFFASKEWELCYINTEQQATFFADSEAPPGAISNWESAEPRRRKLYFQVYRRQAAALENAES